MSWFGSALPPPPRPATVAVVLALAAALVLVLRSGGTGSVPGSPPRAEVEELLAVVGIVEGRPDVPGYERGCGSGEGCVFGPAWSDAHDAPGGGNGCSTREDVLRRDVAADHPPRSCEVADGRVRDPYTGRELDTAAVGTREIHVDHVIPLAAAWDLGAHAWSEEQRIRFANDVDANLLAVAGRVNMQKGDLTPGEWMPPAAPWRCFYAARYLTAAVRYALPVTEGDHRALSRAAKSCPRRGPGSRRRCHRGRGRSPPSGRGGRRG